VYGKSADILDRGYRSIADWKCVKLPGVYAEFVPQELVKSYRPPMAAKTENVEPVYRRMQRAIQREIEEGKLRPGDPILSERELARAYGVSLMTARNALSGLEWQGIVERRRGAGTFVAVPKVDYNKLLSTTELMASKGALVRSRVLCVKLVEDQPEIAARLGFPIDSALIKLERLRQIEREPLALEASYLPADRYSELLRRPLEGGSLFMTLETRYKVQIAYSDEEVDASPSDKRVAKLLGIEPGAPLMRIRQVIYSTANQPILYVLGLYRYDRHTLHVRRMRR